MSNRKATPDILGEILGSAPTTGNAPSTNTGNADANLKGTDGSREPKAPSPSTHKPRRHKTEAQAKPPARTAWEYMTVVLAEHHGWRPRMVNETELENWKYQPLLREFLNVVGGYGWELTAVIDAGRDRKEAYFKRPNV